MTSYISRCRRWWTLVRELDNTLELGDTVQGSMMLKQAGLSWFENMVLTHSNEQRTVDMPIAEALLEQRYVRAPSSGARHPRRQAVHLPPFVGDVDTGRAYLAQAEPIKESTDTAVYGKKACLTTTMASRTSQKTMKSMRRTSPLFWAPRAETQTDDALAEALQLDGCVAAVQRQEQRQGKRTRAKARERPNGNSRAVPIAKRAVRADIGPETTSVPRMPRATVRRSHRRAGIWLSEAKHLVSTSPCSAAITSADATAWPTHALMPATSRVETPPKAPPGA